MARMSPKAVYAALGLTLGLVWFILLGAVVGSSQLALLGFILIIILIIMLGLIYTATTAIRGKARALNVVSYLQQAARLNLPMPEMLGAMAASTTGRGAAHFEQCRLAIERGEPVAVVLSGLPGFPQRLVAPVAAAEYAGRLPQVLTRILDQHHRALSRHATRRELYRVYPLVLVVGLISIVGMMMVFVMPKFEMVFRDFGIELPTSTRTLLWFCREFGTLIFTLTAAWLLTWGGFIIFGQRNAMRHGLDESLTEWILNRLPLIGRMRMYGALADVLAFAADGIESQRPFTTSILEAGELSDNSRLRRRIDNWSTGILQGDSIAVAARSAGMPPLLCGLLSTASHADATASVFRFASRYYATRFGRMLATLEAMIIPALALGMGMIVGWVALSLFQAMMAIIDGALPYQVSL